MKFWDEYFDKGEIIENYDKSESSIIINYLDGSNYVLPLSKENENKIIDLMIKQAILRDCTKSFNDIQDKKNITFENQIVSGLATLAFGGIAFFANKNEKDLISLIASIETIISGITFIINGLAFMVNSEELNELAKYHLYLEYRERLEKMNTPNLFNGIREKHELNINTLDNFSLNDMRVIINNLKKCEKMESLINTYSNDSKLTR